MAFDGKPGRVVLFGGLPVFTPQDPTLTDQVLGDTWEHADQGGAAGARQSITGQVTFIIEQFAAPGETTTAVFTIT